jgi:hypothetical protein
MQPDRGSRARLISTLLIALTVEGSEVRAQYYYVDPRYAALPPEDQPETGPAQGAATAVASNAGRLRHQGAGRRDPDRYAEHLPLPRA